MASHLSMEERKRLSTLLEAGFSRAAVSRALPIMLLGQCIEPAQALVPLGFERVGDEAMFGIDLEVAPARELGVDRVELRRKNMLPESALPYQSPVGPFYDCGQFEKNLDMAIKLADVAGFAARQAESKKRGKLRGLGIVNAMPIYRSEWSGMGTTSRRFTTCNSQIRGVPLSPQDDEYRNVEYYLSYVSNGLPISGPGARP